MFRCPAFPQCTACSEAVTRAYAEGGADFLLSVFNQPSVLEDLTGLSALQRAAAEAALDWDEEGDEEAPAGTAAPPPAQLQLRVRLPGGELLLLPAVPEIVPAWSPAEGLLLGYPPPACSSSPAPTFRTSPRLPPPAAAPPRWPKWSSRTCGATRCPTGAPTA